MANQDWRNQLATAYGNMQKGGYTRNNPVLPGAEARRARMREQVNPPTRQPIETFAPLTGGPDPRPMMPPEVAEPAIAPAVQPLSPYPDVITGTADPQVGTQPAPDYTTTTGTLPGALPPAQQAPLGLSVAPNQPVAEELPVPGLEPVVPGGGAW